MDSAVAAAAGAAAAAGVWVAQTLLWAVGWAVYAAGAGIVFVVVGSVVSVVGGKVFVAVLRAVASARGAATGADGAATGADGEGVPPKADGEGDELLSLLPDEVIGASWVFRAAKALTLPAARWVWGLRIEGFERVDRDAAALFVTCHTSHNADIFANIFATQDETGRVTRSLVHRLLATALPWLRFLGSVPGYRRTAVEMLKAGFWVAVIPGGVEEAMAGYDAAYTVGWSDKRKGFAKVAAAAQVPIVPVFTSNSEEMKFVPLFWLWTKVGGGAVYTAGTKVPGVGWLVELVGICVWFVNAWISIPIPVAATVHIGDPIAYDPERTVDETVEATKAALRGLIAEHQPEGLSYWRGVRERFGWS